MLTSGAPTLSHLNWSTFSQSTSRFLHLKDEAWGRLKSLLQEWLGSPGLVAGAQPGWAISSQPIFFFLIFYWVFHVFPRTSYKLTHDMEKRLEIPTPNPIIHRENIALTKKLLIVLIVFVSILVLPHQGTEPYIICPVNTRGEKRSISERFTVQDTNRNRARIPCSAAPATGMRGFWGQSPVVHLYSLQ